MGYLFLCPPKHFQTGPSSFRWPECPTYWSLDPSGVEHLGIEDATALGFPSISLSTEIRGLSWDGSVYTGLHQFHQAKGFDPDSQDVARHLGEPLYYLAAETDVPFAHGKSTRPRKSFWLTNSNFIQVDDEYLYSDEDDQDPVGIDNSDDTRSSAWEDDG
jgi:hypothetical protein